LDTASPPGTDASVLALQPKDLERLAGLRRIPAALEVVERWIFARFAPLAARLANAPDVTEINEVGESLEKFRVRALE
jgi:hypothetical protein